MEKGTMRGLYQAKAARRLGRRSAWTVPWFTPPSPPKRCRQFHAIDRRGRDGRIDDRRDTHPVRGKRIQRETESRGDRREWRFHKRIKTVGPPVRIGGVAPCWRFDRASASPLHCRGLAADASLRAPCDIETVIREASKTVSSAFLPRAGAGGGLVWIPDCPGNCRPPGGGRGSGTAGSPRDGPRLRGASGCRARGSSCGTTRRNQVQLNSADGSDPSAFALALLYGYASARARDCSSRRAAMRWT